MLYVGRWLPTFGTGMLFRNVSDLHVRKSESLIALGPSLFCNVPRRRLADGCRRFGTGRLYRNVSNLHVRKSERLIGLGPSLFWDVTYRRLLVALLIQHATRMCHIVTSFVAPLAPPYFSTLSHKRHDFRKKIRY